MRLRLALTVAVVSCGDAPPAPTSASPPSTPPPAAAPTPPLRSPVEASSAAVDLVEIPGGELVMGQVGGAHPGIAPGGGGPRPGGPIHPNPAAGGRPPSGGPPPLHAPAQPGGPPPQVSGPLQRWQHRDGVVRQVQTVRVAPFRIDRTEVTRAAYQVFLDATGYRPPHVDEPWADQGWSWAEGQLPPGTGDHPVVLTSWYDATEFCAWRGARLPTEAEWQLAALGPGEGQRFPWGDDYDAANLNHGKMEQPNFDDSDGYLTTAPAGAFPGGASPFGLLDTFGNAWEWTADARFEDWNHIDARQDGAVRVNPRGHPPSLYVAVRGGSYFFDVAANPIGERHAFLPEIRRKTSGFRCAADPL